MQGPALGTQSARSRVSLAVSLLIALTLVIVAVLSYPNATRVAASSNSSRKPSSPEFVPGEALVRFRSERIAKRQTLQTLVSREGRLGGAVGHDAPAMGRVS